MATTVHLPQQLLDRLDARARALKVSRNRLIVEAVQQSLAADADWSPELLAMLREPLDDELSAALDEMTAAIVQRRKSKPAPAL